MRACQEIRASSRKLAVSDDRYGLVRGVGIKRTFIFDVAFGGKKHSREAT